MKLNRYWPAIILLSYLLYGCGGTVTDAELMDEPVQEVAEQTEIDKVEKTTSIELAEDLLDTIQFEQVRHTAGIDYMLEDAEWNNGLAELHLSELDLYQVHQKLEELITDELFTQTLNFPGIQAIDYSEDVKKFTYLPLDEESEVQPANDHHLKYAVFYHLFAGDDLEGLVFEEVAQKGEQEIQLRSVQATDIYQDMVANGF